jgi:hypothetical protein
VTSFTFVPPAREEWVPGGETHLDAGSYEATVLLPPGSSLSFVEIAPPCLAAIEPPGGWHATAVTTATDLAVTGLRALDLESELPPADLPIEVAAADFEEDGDEPTLAAAASVRVLRGGPTGLRATVSFTVPDPGLYTVYAFGSAGAGQRWTADGCRKATLCPSASAGWRPVLSQAFSAGRHTLAVALGDGAVVERVRLERKRDAPADYVGTLRRIGFDPGPDGPVSRERAGSAMDFLRDRYRAAAERRCGDLALPDRTPPLVAQVAGGGGPGSGTPGLQVAPPGTGAPTPPSGLEVAVLPPQDTASPVTPVGFTAEAPR